MLSLEVFAQIWFYFACGCGCRVLPRHSGTVHSCDYIHQNLSTEAMVAEKLDMVRHDCTNRGCETTWLRRAHETDPGLVREQKKSDFLSFVQMSLKKWIWLTDRTFFFLQFENDRTDPVFQREPGFLPYFWRPDVMEKGTWRKENEYNSGEHHYLDVRPNSKWNHSRLINFFLADFTEELEMIQTRRYYCLTSRSKWCCKCFTEITPFILQRLIDFRFW